MGDPEVCYVFADCIVFLIVLIVHFCSTGITQLVIFSGQMCDPFNHGLIIKKLHRLREFNQKALLKPYIEMNTELRRKTTTTKITSLIL